MHPQTGPLPRPVADSCLMFVIARDVNLQGCIDFAQDLLQGGMQYKHLQHFERAYLRIHPRHGMTTEA